MSLLRVDDLSVCYQTGDQKVLAVDQVSFSIEPGEIVAIIGESGSGKSSLALAITRLLPRSSAQICARRILFEDTDLLEASEASLRNIRGGRISYVFQDPSSSLNPVLTIGEQLRETILTHTRCRKSEADPPSLEWLRKVGIPQEHLRLSAYPHEFSGGMQQRVMIAMAMASRPALLIADEPTSALDVTVQVQILRLLREFQQRFGLAILLICHDLLIVRRLAQRVMVLYQGRVVETGAVNHVFEQPAHPYTRRLLEARAYLSGPLK